MRNITKAARGGFVVRKISFRASALSSAYPETKYIDSIYFFVHITKTIMPAVLVSLLTLQLNSTKT